VTFGLQTIIICPGHCEHGRSEVGLGPAKLSAGPGELAMFITSIPKNLVQYHTIKVLTPVDRNFERWNTWIFGHAYIYIFIYLFDLHYHPAFGSLGMRTSRYAQRWCEFVAVQVNSNTRPEQSSQEPRLQVTSLVSMALSASPLQLQAAESHGPASHTASGRKYLSRTCSWGAASSPPKVPMQVACTVHSMA